MTHIEKLLVSTKKLVDAAYKRGYVAGVMETLAGMGIAPNKPVKPSLPYPRPKLGHTGTNRR